MFLYLQDMISSIKFRCEWKGKIGMIPYIQMQRKVASKPRVCCCFFYQNAPIGAKMQGHVIILPIDGINAIKQCHLYRE